MIQHDCVCVCVLYGALLDLITLHYSGYNTLQYVHCTAQHHNTTHYFTTHVIAIHIVILRYTMQCVTTHWMASCMMSNCMHMHGLLGSSSDSGVSHVLRYGMHGVCVVLHHVRHIA